MQVTVLKEIPEDPDLSEAWNTLVLAMENPEVFFTYQWALAASRGFQQRLSPLLFLMYDSGQLAGVVALAIDPNAPRAAFFLTSSTADYCDIVSTPANRKPVLLALLQEIRKLGLSDIVFANVPANSATLQELPSIAGSRNFYVTSRTAYNCGVIQLGGEEQRETLLRDLATRGREKRALKKLTNLGEVKVIHVTEPEQIGVSLESIVSAQISRFLASNRVSPLVGPERRTFLHQLSDLLSHSGWLKISQLEIDGRAVAWNYGFRFGGSWFWYLANLPDGVRARVSRILSPPSHGGRGSEGCFPSMARPGPRRRALQGTICQQYPADALCPSVPWFPAARRQCCAPDAHPHGQSLS